MICSTCWFANGDGVSRHCRRCSCCDTHQKRVAEALDRLQR